MATNRAIASHYATDVPLDVLLLQCRCEGSVGLLHINRAMRVHARAQGTWP